MDLIKYIPKKLDINFAEYENLKEKILAETLEYKNLIYTDENINEAKSDKKIFVDFKAKIDRLRIDMKNEYMTSFNEFEVKIKDILKPVNGVIDEIAVQQNAYKDKAKEEKQKAIQEIYLNEVNSELIRILPLNSIFDIKWLNVATSLKKIKEDITKIAIRVESDLTIIDNFAPELKTQVKDFYLQTLDLGKALQEKTRLEEQAKKLVEYEKQHAIELENKQAKLKIQKEEVDKLDVDTQIVVDEAIKSSKAEIDFRIWATDEELELLKIFLITNNIRYGKVK